jgi:hypothetical protein
LTESFGEIDDGILHKSSPEIANVRTILKRIGNRPLTHFNVVQGTDESNSAGKLTDVMTKKR